MKTDTTCAVCGRTVVQTAGKGRPRAYHAQCNKLASMISYLSTVLTETAGDMTPDARRKMRRELWHVANLLNVPNTHTKQGGSL